MRKKVKIALRGLPLETKQKYRLLAAQITKNTGEAQTLNALYVQALVAFVKKPKNVDLIEQ